MGEQISRQSLNQRSMQVILHAGNARDIVVNILDKLSTNNKTNDYSGLEEKILKAHTELAKAHACQTDILQLEANEQDIPYSALFGHAQDTLMTAKSELLLVEKMLPIFKKMEGLT